jgi:hypothetical protein|tara:strand:+ start:1072 stop:1341 length:270 start_codon:yes stop_codon:yes gene_type:complete
MNINDTVNNADDTIAKATELLKSTMQDKINSLRELRKNIPEGEEGDETRNNLSEAQAIINGIKSGNLDVLGDLDSITEKFKASANKYTK